MRPLLLSLSVFAFTAPVYAGDTTPVNRPFRFPAPNYATSIAPIPVAPAWQMKSAGSYYDPAAIGQPIALPPRPVTQEASAPFQMVPEPRQDAATAFPLPVEVQSIPSDQTAAEAAANGLGLGAAMTGLPVSVLPQQGTAGTQKEEAAATAALPVTLPAAEPSAAAAPVPDTIIAAAVPQTESIEPKAAEASPEFQAVVAAVADIPQQPKWQTKPGQSLADTIRQWCEQAGMGFYTAPENEGLWSVIVADSFTGSFEDALLWLKSGFPDRPRPEFHISSNNQVILKQAH